MTLTIEQRSKCVALTKEHGVKFTVHFDDFLCCDCGVTVPALEVSASRLVGDGVARLPICVLCAKRLTLTPALV